MTSPYLLPEPAVVSFSGGRTSGFMLWNILQAFGGTLPPWVKVVFCNTGKEREETLYFVERVSLEWGVDITWLEYRWEPGRHYFVEVNYATASRQGEPFEQLQAHRAAHREGKGLPLILPNPVQRYCTTEMKIRTCHRYVTEQLGWSKYHDAIGLRADEPKRVANLRRNRKVLTEQTLFGEERIVVRAVEMNPGATLFFPLHDAGATEADVMDFWAKRPFDLELKQYQGNCDLCFLKNVKKILAVMRERPDLADWWIRQEEATGARFRNDRPSYRELLAIAQGKEEGPGWLWSDDKTGACGEMDECRCTD